MSYIYDELELPNLKSAIQADQASYIYELVHNIKPKNSIEIGLAYGASAVNIAAGTQGIHYIIDPIQNDF